MGPDQIHQRVLIQLATAVVSILTAVFNKSLHSGEVLEDWRKANVAPIFKKGKRYNAENYRPISLTCIASKIMEHIVTKHIMKHLECNNILYMLQHGFRAKRSNETQLLTFVQDLYKNLRDNSQTDVIVMDFAKAFDKVFHKKLIRKLRGYGINSSINQWIESFLHQRQRRAVCEGEISLWVSVTSGVPQGSLIGPILFLVFINDLPAKLQSKVRLFADNTILYMAVTNETDAAILQKDLNFLKNGKIDHRCASTWTSVMCQESHGAGTPSPMITSYITKSLKRKMQLNILASLYTIRCLGTNIYAL